MTFFARPILSDEQFKQLSGTTLTLSGQTRIANPNGFALSDGIGGYVPVIATGGTNYDVLTYCNGQIILHTPTSGTSSGTYTCSSPTTVTVGGLPAGSPISGCPISRILEEILVPTVCPTVISPSQSAFLFSPSTSVYEVNSCIALSITSCFSRGCNTPQFCGTSPFRSGLPSTYNYTGSWGTCAILSTALCNTLSFACIQINAGNNTISGTVCYSIGPTPTYNSCGGVYCTVLPAGVTSPACSCILCGMYPYFYGKVASGGCPAGVKRPTATCALVIGGTKVVADSTGTLSINFNSSADDYIWFATPYASTTKTVWYVDALNNGTIGGAVSPGGNLFPNNTPVCPVATALWGGQCYKVYISNYQTASASIMQLRNS